MLFRSPKPEAPAEIRGPFATIPTSVPGTFFTEHCANCAKIAHKFTVVRSHSHADNGHMTGYYYVMTGRKPTFPDGEHPIPTNELYPSLGSWVARELGPRGRVPAYINMPHPMSAGGPGFLGAEYAPFVIEADPSQPDFEVKDLSAVTGLSSLRLAQRQKLLAGLEQNRARGGRAAFRPNVGQVPQGAPQRKEHHGSRQHAQPRGENEVSKGDLGDSKRIVEQVEREQGGEPTQEDNAETPVPDSEIGRAHV